VVGLTLFFVLISRQTNKKKTVDHIDKNENFYLNGDEENIEPIQVCTLL
jgi:hypothetical protein